MLIRCIPVVIFSTLGAWTYAQLPANFPLPQRTAPPARTPLPVSGSERGVQYTQDPANPGFYNVTYGDPPRNQVVGEKFLSTVLSHPETEKDKGASLDNYPSVMDSIYGKVMTDSYPTAQDASGAPYPTSSYTGSDGTKVTVSQDELAAPYLRIKVEKDGQTQEYSVNKKVNGAMLGNAQLTDDKRIELLQRYPNRLPENVRSNFKDYKQEDIWREAMKDPRVRSQEPIAAFRILHGDSVLTVPVSMAPTTGPLRKSTPPPGYAGPVGSMPLRVRSSGSDRTPDAEIPEPVRSASRPDKESSSGVAVQWRGLLLIVVGAGVAWAIWGRRK